MPQKISGPDPIEIRLDILIRRSPEDVFSFVCETGNFDSWQDGIVHIEQLDPGPWRPGTRIRTIHRFLIWNRLEDHSEIISLEKNRNIMNRGRVGKTEYREEFSFAPEGANTRLIYRADILPGGVFVSLRTVAAWAFRLQMRSSFDKLKQLLERVERPTHPPPDARVI